MMKHRILLKKENHNSDRTNLNRVIYQGCYAYEMHKKPKMKLSNAYMNIIVRFEFGIN